MLVWFSLVRHVQKQPDSLEVESKAAKCRAKQSEAEELRNRGRQRNNRMPTTGIPIVSHLAIERVVCRPIACKAKRT